VVTCLGRGHTLYYIHADVSLNMPFIIATIQQAKYQPIHSTTHPPINKAMSLSTYRKPNNVTGYTLDIHGALLQRGGSSPGRGKRFFFSPKRPDRLWGPPSPLFNGYRGSFPGLQRPGREVNHSPPSSAEVKNEWSHTSDPPICLHGVNRDNFTFTLLKRELLHLCYVCSLNIGRGADFVLHVECSTLTNPPKVGGDCRRMGENREPCPVVGRGCLTSIPECW
jgi:hypothetical protein